MTDKVKYINLFEKYKTDLPLFYYPHWLDAVTDGSWDMKIIEKDGELAALMPICQKSKYGLHAVFTPQLTPFFGIYTLPHHFDKTTKTNAYQNELISSLLATIPDVHYYLIPFHHSFEYGFPLVYNGYKSTIRYTYQLDEIKDHERLFSDFKSSLRNKIRKAEKNIKIEESNDIDVFYDTINKTFERQNLTNPTSKKLISNIYKALPENSKILLAKDESGSVHAAHFLVWDDTCAYNLMLGGDTELRSSGAIPLLLWNSIKTASKHVDTYDFEGSILPTVQPFFESFGAKVVSYHQYYKAKNKIWELLFNLTNKF